MTNQLTIDYGQYSDKGRKPINQDFHGIYIPESPQLDTKGIAVALADGIGSSQVSQEASEAAISSFHGDYYSTSEAWSVKKSAVSVLRATNSWLYAHNRRSQFRYERDKGYVCTFSGMILKSSTAHIFHAGDSRIYRLTGSRLEQLTEEHRVKVSDNQHYLSRALGMDSQLDLDYLAIDLREGDTFFLVTDGIYEFLEHREMAALFASHANDLPTAAKCIADKALEYGSDDNLTVQVVRIKSLSKSNVREKYPDITRLPFLPTLEPRMELDGCTIVRQLYVSARSHVFLAFDPKASKHIVIKTPAVEQRSNEEYLERFLLEEWIARRIASPHVLKPCNQTRERNYFYIATEYIEGQTLTQWMIDNPHPSLETVRVIVEQIAKGLHAFHRLEMLHQDLRPENIMIDKSGTVKIIDFGSTRVAGLQEMSASLPMNDILGTAQYTAPEYFLGEYPSSRSDLFSLAVITYQMLSSRLPYGAEVAKARTRNAQSRLTYRSVLDNEREIPVWVDFTLRKALHPNPLKRYEEIGEFIVDLRKPNKAFSNQARPPLIERNPIAFWKGLSILLFLIITLLMFERLN